MVREQNKGEFTRSVEVQDIQKLSAGEVLVRVHYSSLNYKDALSASGNRGVTRRYPHTPGIDAAGFLIDLPPDGISVGFVAFPVTFGEVRIIQQFIHPGQGFRQVGG